MLFVPAFAIGYKAGFHTDVYMYQIGENKAHVQEMVERHTIPNFLEEDQIREFYVFDRAYKSSVQSTG